MSGTATAQDLKDFLTCEANALGFDAIGVTPLADNPDYGTRLKTFLDHDYHGDMTWMEATAERRAAPRALWPDARTAIMFGQSYRPETDPLAILEERTRGAISIYAQGRDYHDVLKTKIKTLARRFSELSGADVKVFVDTAPLMEKPLAVMAGLGWQGKHTNLVSREHGSWLFLGAILTTAEIAADLAENDRCGTCTRCLDVCPTKAFPAPYQLDARRCIAYLTIEHKGHIAKQFREAIGNRVFGCDDCLAVCPWNKFAHAARETKFAARIETDNPPLSELLVLDEQSFRARFAGTPIKRTGRDRVVRNALIAAGNSGDKMFLPAVETLLVDASALVRAMAVWALLRLGDETRIAALRAKYAAEEQDPDVAAEWCGEAWS